MILKEFTTDDAIKLNKLVIALHETYNYKVDFTNMTVTRAKKIIENANIKKDASKTVQDRIRLGMIAESLSLWTVAEQQTELTQIAEGLGDDEMESAKVILAAKELSDTIQGMIETAAKMQVQELLPIVDAMKTEVGTAEADTFSSSADMALGALVDACKSAKEEYDNAIMTAQGEQIATDMDDMGGIDDLDVSDDMDLDDMELDGMTDTVDDFDGDDANVSDNQIGREMKAGA